MAGNDNGDVPDAGAVPEAGGGAPGERGHANGNSITQAVTVRLPPELIFLIETHQNACRMRSFSYALQSIVETHPAIVESAARLYAALDASSGRDTRKQQLNWLSA